MAKVLKRFFTFTTTHANIAATANNPQSFQVEADSDFYWLKAEAFVYDTNGAQIAPTSWARLTVLLSEGTSQQQLTNDETPIANLFGTSQLPYILPSPHRVIGGATLTATVYNRHASTAYWVQLSFTGIIVPAGSVLSAAKK